MLRPGAMVIRSFLVTQAGILSLASMLLQAEPQSSSIALAKSVFADAQAVSNKEGGHLWGRKLYARMLLVDPDTRAVVANEQDPKKVLHAVDGVYVGTLPDNLIISNAPTEWEGLQWTMLMSFTIPDDTMSRRIAFAHELFHQMQFELKLVASDEPALDLDTMEGRVWLQLEWRALAAALIDSGSAQTSAIRDALAFRAYRQTLFPKSAETEAAQEIAEGIPEYTGVMAGEDDVYAARWHAAAQLIRPDTSVSFVRSFAYTSGPGYGLLLDERLPGWRRRLTTQTDLAALLKSTLKTNVTVSAPTRAPDYGASEIQHAEAARVAKAEAQKSHYRALLIDGSTLVLPNLGQFSFNPNALISLDDAGTVYPTLHAVADWGTLDVKEGVLVPIDRKGAMIAAPENISGPHLVGKGWTLDLAPGWSAVPGPKPGSYMLHQ